MFSKPDSDFQNCSHMNFYALSWENQCSHQKCNHTFSSLNPLPEAFTCQSGLDSQEKRGTTGEERIFKKSFFGERKNSQNKDSEIGNFYVPSSFFSFFNVLTCNFTFKVFINFPFYMRLKHEKRDFRYDLGSRQFYAMASKHATKIQVFSEWGK